MCGIGGVISFSSGLAATPEVLDLIDARLAHRGPDAAGRCVLDTPHAHVALVHRRLAVIDPLARSQQPMTDEAGRTIVFNGEIYNYRQLRDQLPPRPWKTDGDTEVVLAAFDHWGPDCVAKLDGMFAIAIWDAPARRLHLLADPAGQKPLYYGLSADGQAIAFASELHALAAVPFVGREIDPRAMAAYLRWGYVPAPLTIWSRVAKAGLSLRATFAQSADGAHLAVARVDVPQAAGLAGGEAIPDAIATRDVRSALLAAVDRQLVADVPLGCFLSGGVDSSVVALAAQRALAARGAGPLLTFCIGFDDGQYDESPYAERVAGHLGTRHQTFRVTPDAAADLPALAMSFGEPFADSSALPTLYLSRQTRRHVTVALSGDGGDELFGGYDRYRAMAVAPRFNFLPRTLLGLVQRARGTDPRSPQFRAARLARGLMLPAAERYALFMQLFTDAEVSRLLGRVPGGDPVREAIDAHLAGSAAGRRDDDRRAMEVDLATYLPGDLHTKVDRAAMRCALEVRAPFMDPAVRAVAGRLTSAQVGSKAMLRRAFARYLPAEVFSRPKRGFAVPVSRWFRGPLRNRLLDEVLAPGSFVTSVLDRASVLRLFMEHDRRQNDHGQRLYALLMLEMWHTHVAAVR